MKVLFFSNDFPGPHDPTRAVFNLRMCEMLATRHEVRVVSPVAWTERWGGAADAGAVGQVDLSVAYRPYYFPPRILLAERGRFMWWSLRRYLRALVRSWRPEVILVYWTHPDGEAALRLGQEWDIPVVQMVGGSDVLQLQGDKRRWARVSQVLHSVDAVVTIGQHLAGEVVRLGVPRGRVTGMHRPVDTAIFSAGSRALARERLGLKRDGPMLLWVGRIVAVKGLDVLIRALPRLRQAVPDLQCSLVGSGPDQAPLQALARALDVHDLVRFAGAARRDDLVHWYRAANLTVLPSRSEGVPNVLLESMVCGVPFVASGVGGIPEVADAALDRLVPPDDPGALAAAIEESLRTATNGPRRVMPGSPERFAQQLDAVLWSAVRRRDQAGAVA